MSAGLETTNANGSTLTELLLLRQGAEYFAFVLASAMEALELPVLTPVPEAPAMLLGMFTGRGAGIPVFAGNRILGVHGQRPDDAVLLFVRDGARQVGLVVDEVEDVIMADLTTMQQPMDSMRAGGIVRGVVKSGNRLVAVLDARAIVRMGARALPELA